MKFAKLVQGCAMGLVIMAAGCGDVLLPVVPEDCVLFISRAEARGLYALVLEERAEGASEIEAAATVVIECIDNNCEIGESGGVCAINCASCTDALVEIAYE